MRTLYPAIEPYRTGFLQVDSIYNIYFEESGNPNGTPVLFLHGGPGTGTDPNQRRFFNPDKYRIILLDQRGAGKSTPHAELKDNTTWTLIEDIEKIRTILLIDSWVVFGGSWGSTLSLAYAISHPERVRALVLRGIFLCREEELKWFCQSGAHRIFPDAWERFIAPIPEDERSDLITAYHKRLTTLSGKELEQIAHTWAAWEAETVRLRYDPDFYKFFTATERAQSIARIECHYFVNHAFFPSENWIVENVSKIRHIPAVIVHGRYDVICPVENAWLLHKAWPEAKLEIIPDAGHASSEIGITDALIRATDAFSLT